MKNVTDGFTRFCGWIDGSLFTLEQLKELSNRIERARDRLVEDEILNDFENDMDYTDMIMDEFVEIEKSPVVRWSELFVNTGSTISFSQSCSPNSLGTCGSTMTQQKDNNMGYEYNMEVDQRNHLKRRLEVVRNDKSADIRVKYHIDDQHPAQTKEEIINAFKAGEFDLPGYLFGRDGKLAEGYVPQAWLKAPTKDTDGYNAAEKLLGAAYTEAKDLIIVAPLADGLKALNAFEAATF